MLNQTTLDVADSADRDLRPRLGALWLRLIHGAGAPRDVRLALGEHVLGRGEGVAVRLDEPTLSRQHCLIRLTRRAAVLERLEGAKRVWVDGAEVPPGASAKLTNGALVRVGDVLFVVRDAPPPVDFVWGPAPGRAPAMAQVRAQLAARLGGDGPALVLGETGTGKDFVAHALHGSRSGRFVPLDCSGLSERGLARAELFGARKGAFTGAIDDTWGVVSQAAKGTLFLDEIGDLPVDVQPLLLRLIEYGTYHRVGDSQVREAAVRVVAATHMDLDAAVEHGQFRLDLLARLQAKGGLIRLPPLRERREDLPDWAEHFAREAGGSGRMDAGFVEAIALYPWPANLRELSAAVQQALADGADLLTARRLPERVREARQAARRQVRRVSSEEVSEQTLRAVLAAAPNLRAAADQLGLSRDQLRRLRAKHGLT